MGESVRSSITRLKSIVVHKVLGSFNFAAAFRRFVVAAVAVIVTTVAVSSVAHANPKYAGIVIDAKTGKVLYGENADSLRYPASLTKMMTLYIAFQDIEAGRLVRVLEDWTPPLARLCLYYPGRRNHSAAFKALIEMAHGRAG